MTEHNDKDLQNDPWWKKMMGTKKEHLVEKLEKALAEIEGQKALINEERNTVHKTRSLYFDTNGLITYHPIQAGFSSSTSIPVW